MEKQRKIGGTYYFQKNLLNRIEDLYNFFFLMFISRLFLMNPVYGGALYISGLVLINYFKIFGPKFSSPDKKQKTIAIILLPPAILITAYLAVVYPIRFFNINNIFMLSMTAVILLRSVVDRIIKSNIYRLMLYILLVLAYVPFVLIFSDSGLPAAIPVGLVIGCIITYIKNIFSSRKGVEEDAEDKIKVRRVRNINSYRLYANTVIVVTAAIQIMLMMYVSYMRYVTKANLIGNILNTYMITLTAVVVLFAVAAFLQKKVRLEHYEKTLIFVIAAVSSIIAAFNLFNSGARLSSFSTYINIAAFVLGISFVFLILIAMQEDFKGVFSIEKSRADRTVNGQMYLLDRTSMFVAYYTVMIMLATLCMNREHQSAVITNPGIYTKLVTFYMLLVPAVFIFLGIIYSIRQPLTRKYIEKLKWFRENKKSRRNPDLRSQLENVLVKKHKNKFGIKVIAFVLYPIMKHTVEGQENVGDVNPAVFVCNHKRVYGPMVTNLYMPYICRPWIISGMVEKDEIYDHMINGYNVKESKLPWFIKKFLVRILSPVYLWAMNSVEPIPVYRNRGRDIIKTINITVEAMEQEDNILIFPEDQTKTEGFTDKPGEFFMGFSHIGRAYFNKTGKKITFYPMYADSEKKIIFIGKGIKYDPGNSSHDERDRIVAYLKKNMDDMARQ